MGNVVTAIATPVLETDGSQMKYARCLRLVTESGSAAEVVNHLGAC